MSKKITRFQDTKYSNVYINVGDTVNGKAIDEISVSSIGIPYFMVGNNQYSWEELLLILPDASMNKHIELVKKWLDDPSSVTVVELRVNRDSALDTQAKAFADNTANGAAYYNAYNAAYYAYVASKATNPDWDGSNIAAGYVKKYEELIAEREE